MNPNIANMVYEEGEARLAAVKAGYERELDRLRGLLREVRTKHWPFLTDGLHERVYDAINGAAVQPEAARCHLCNGTKTVLNDLGVPSLCPACTADNSAVASGENQ